MRKLLIKIILFSAPFFIFLFYNAYQNLIIPPTAHSFRIWEALVVSEPNEFLSGPFYPNFDVSMSEGGDTAQGIALISTLKEVAWQTDRYGYREITTGRNPDIVIIGDSFTVGTAQDQTETISERIQEKTGLETYAYAPKSFNHFINEKRFIENPPKIVILEATEKLVLHTVGNIKNENTGYATMPPFIKNNKLLIDLAVMNDRLKKSNFTNSLIANFNTILTTYVVGILNKLKNTSPVDAMVADEIKSTQDINPEMSKDEVIGITGFHISKDKTMVFSVQSEEYFTEISERDVEDLIEKLISYRDYLSAKGIEFIFLPIPNKENIYYKQVRGGSRQNFIHRLVAKARKNNIRVIDTATAFEQSRDKDPKQLIYFADDGHWTPYGVEIASELLKQEIILVSAK